MGRLGMRILVVRLPEKAGAGMSSQDGVQLASIRALPTALTAAERSMQGGRASPGTVIACTHSERTHALG